MYSVVNSGDDYDDKLFRKYLSLINKLAEEYLNVLQMRKENPKRELNILEQLFQRDLSDVFKKKLKAFEKNIGKENKLDPENFLFMHHLNILKSNQRFSQNEARKNFEEFAGVYQNLVNYFVYESGSIINQYDTYKYSYKENKKDISPGIFLKKIKIEEQIKEMRNSVSPGNKDTILFLDIVLNLIKLNSPETGLEAYTKFKKIISKNINKLSKRFLFECMKNLNVFCILEGVRGENDMNRELFKNHKIMLQNNLFYNDEIKDMNLVSFRVILRTALKVNELDWAANFVNENYKKISEKSRTDVYNFAHALLAFHKNDYSGAFRHISGILKITSLFPMSIDIYVLKVKIFYELGYIDSAKSAADSFRHYITGNKLVSDYLKSVLLNFLKFYKTIVRLKYYGSESALINFISEIKNSKDTIERKWLNKKAEELLEAIKFHSIQEKSIG